jgi:predicted transcriptional regulator
MNPETQLQQAILDGLEKLGFWAIRINAGRRGGVRMAPKGTPDILVLQPYVWLECKLKDGELNENQEVFFERAKKEGVPRAVVRSLSEAISVVRGAAMVESRQRYEIIQDALNRLSGRS